MDATVWWVIVGLVCVGAVTAGYIGFMFSASSEQGVSDTPDALDTSIDTPESSSVLFTVDYPSNLAITTLQNIDSFSFESDRFTLIDQTYNATTQKLTALVSYIGGCSTHQFTLHVWESQDNYFITHDDGGDSCHQPINEHLVFSVDLREPQQSAIAEPREFTFTYD